MVTISVVYHTGTVHTGALAVAIAKGAEGVEDATIFWRFSYHVHSQVSFNTEQVDEPIQGVAEM